MTLIIGTDADTNDVVKIEYDDLTLGTAIIGKTGSGKSALLSHMIQECVRQGTCSFVFDPHGDLCRTVINTTPRKFIDNLILIDIDPAMPFHLNPFYFTNPAEILAVDNNATNFVTLFKKILGMNERQILVDRVLQNIATVLIENQGHTLLDVPKLLQEKPFRNNLLPQVTNAAVVRYWQQDYEHTYADPRARSEEINPVLRRIGMLTEQNFLYRIFARPEPTIKFGELLHTRKVYLINLSQLSESNIELLGTILLFQLACSIYARAGTTKRPRVELFIDEFGKFALSDITANLLLQGRKFECSITVAVQVLASLPDEKNKGAFFQAGNIISFQAVGDDSGEIAKNLDCTPPVVPARKLAVPQNVIDQLISSHTSHPNPRVRELVTVFLRPIVEEMRAEIRQGPTIKPIRETGQRYSGTTPYNERGEFTGSKHPRFEAYTYTVGYQTYDTTGKIRQVRQKVNALLYDSATGTLPPDTKEGKLRILAIIQEMLYGASPDKQPPRQLRNDNLRDFYINVSFAPETWTGEITLPPYFLERGGVRVDPDILQSLIETEETKLFQHYQTIWSENLRQHNQDTAPLTRFLSSLFTSQKINSHDRGIPSLFQGDCEGALRRHRPNEFYNELYIHACNRAAQYYVYGKRIADEPTFCLPKKTRQETEAIIAQMLVWLKQQVADGFLGESVIHYLRDKAQYNVTIPCTPEIFAALKQQMEGGIATTFLSYAFGLFELCNLLAEEENRLPLLVPAGFDAVPERPLTYQDMARKIANDLANLPKFTMLCQFTTDTGIQQQTVRLKDPLPWLKQITEEEVRQTGQARFGKPWQPVQPPPTRTEHGKKTSPEPPERKTWEEE